MSCGRVEGEKKKLRKLQYKDIKDKSHKSFGRYVVVNKFSHTLSAAAAAIVTSVVIQHPQNIYLLRGKIVCINFLQNFIDYDLNTL